MLAASRHKSVWHTVVAQHNDSAVGGCSLTKHVSTRLRSRLRCRLTVLAQTPHLERPVRDPVRVQVRHCLRHLPCGAQQGALRHVQRPRAARTEGAVGAAGQGLQVALQIEVRGEGT